MDSFSWSDALRACLPCLHVAPSQPSDDRDDSPGPHRIPRARPDELEGLLADVPDTDNEGETLSLHSNIGDANRRRRIKSKRNGKSKRITIFGYDLFGRPAIQLPPDEEDRGGLAATVNGNGNVRRGRRRESSHSTLDSDAAPLDPSLIDNLSSPARHPPSALPPSPPERTPSEERRFRRQQRKELKRAAAAFAFAEEGDFEGFPGSGNGYPQIPSPFHSQSRMKTSPTVSDDYEYGPFRTAPLPPPQAFYTVPTPAPDDEDDADLGGELYSRRTQSANKSGSDSHSQSQSQSQSNASYTNANPAYYPHQQPRIQLPPHMVPLPRSDGSSSPVPAFGSEVPAPKKKKKSKKSSKVSSSSTTTSQSLASPTSITQHSNNSFPTPSSTTFEGFPMDREDAFSRPTGGEGFPSAGFGGKPRAKGRGERDVGAFLARRGEE